MDYVEKVLALETEWPPERLQDYTLAYLRESCKWAQQKKKELELENKEARRKGVSYEKRQKCTMQIGVLDELFVKWRDRGIEYKRHPVKVDYFVQPTDLPYIEALGFEWHLRAAIIF